MIDFFIIKQVQAIENFQLPDYSITKLGNKQILVVNFRST
jgi:hypothetical protein